MCAFVNKHHIRNPRALASFGAALSVLLGTAVPVSADLVAYWTFNDYADGTLLSATQDSSGNGYTVTNVGTASYAPHISDTDPLYGNHLARDGATVESKSNCNITSAGVYSNNMTISFWGTQPTTNWRNYLTLRTGSTGEEFQFQKANNGLIVYKSNNKNQNAINMVGSSSLDLGSDWHHFVVTVDSAAQKAYMYIDGELINEKEWTHAEQITNLTFNGAWNFGGRGSDANLDEVQIYDQAMTAEQVKYLYNNPSLYHAAVYQRNVSGSGNWSDALWNANGLTGQAFANSSAVKLTASNSPTLTLDQAVTVNSLDFNGSMTISGTNDITFNGEKLINVANAADMVTINVPINTLYDNSLTKTGAGTLTVSSANTYTGGTVINAGTLSISNTTALGTGKITLNGGTLNASAAGSGKTFAYDVEVGENGGAITVAGGSYSSFASLSGSGALTTRGYVSFGGNGGYDGHLTVADGYTRVSEGAFGNFDATVTGQLCIQTDGTLRVGKLNGTGIVFATKAGNVLELGAGTESTDTANFSGTIRGNGNDSKNLTIKKVGAGTQTLSRTGYLFGGTNNSFVEVVVDEGRLIVDAVHSVFTTENTKGFFHCPITINEGGTLEYVRAWTTSPNVALTLNGGTLQLDKSQYLNQLTFNGGTVTQSGAGETPLRAGYVGTGVWNVTGGNSVIETGIGIVKNGNHTTFTLNIADGASLEMKRNIVGLSSHPGSAVNVNGTGANGTGILKLYSGSGLPKVAGLGTVTFNNADVQVNGGMETWSGDGFFSNEVILTNADLNVNPDAGKTIRLDRKISGNGTLTKTGEGTLMLDTANGFAVSSLNVNAGRVNAAGSVTGDLAIAEGASFSPGDGVGTLTLEGNFTADTGAQLVFELSADSSDLLVLSSGSTLDISDDAVLELLFTGDAPGSAYTLIEAEDGLGEYADAAFWTSILSESSAENWHLAVVGNTVQALVGASDAVPEPATWTLLILGASGLYCVRRRNRK
ncbi:MAG: autotransporter-associated beta strand repeat-containing protein [Thermoguttaceae bacterium]|nr:autotransporter-associated beta strand repeat-containing protein [Thermoguttaceae bacterium]